MAIQFRCPGCSEPIEVDDVHGGQTAACPYCRRVVNVPAESALEPSPPAAARPTVDPSPGTIPPGAADDGLQVAPVGSRKSQTAGTLANYALVCTLLVVLLLGAVIGYSAVLMAPELTRDPASQPSPERVAEIEAELRTNSWAGAAMAGAAFFALVGLVLGVTSLVQGRRGNWRATLSTVICGLSLLCFCGSAVLAAVSGLAVPACMG